MTIVWAFHILLLTPYKLWKRLVAFASCSTVSDPMKIFFSSCITFEQQAIEIYALRETCGDDAGVIFHLGNIMLVIFYRNLLVNFLVWRWFCCSCATTLLNVTIIEITRKLLLLHINRSMPIGALLWGSKIDLWDFDVTPKLLCCT